MIARSVLELLSSAPNNEVLRGAPSLAHSSSISRKYT